MSPLPVGPPGRSANIFINYRREDSAGHAGRLFDGLSSHFPGRLFMDIDTIAPGVDFIDAIEKAVGSCEVLIVVIGREWLNSRNAAGQRRLDDPGDFVRLELETALARNIRVIPVLVQGTPMPRPEDLPPSLARLARRNAIELSDVRWAYDVNRLAQTIQGILGEEAAAPPAAAEPPQWQPQPSVPAGKTARPPAWVFLLAALVLSSAVVVASAGWMSRHSVPTEGVAVRQDTGPVHPPASEPPPQPVTKTPASPAEGQVAPAPSRLQAAPATPPRAAPVPRRQAMPQPASPPPSAAPVPSPVTAVVEEAPAPQQTLPQQTLPQQKPPQQTSPAPAKPAPAQATPAAPEIPAQGSEPPAEDLSRLASELSAGGERLVELYAIFLKQKEHAGWKLTASDEKLQEELEAFAEAAEKFNKSFKDGIFARTRDRWLKMDQRTDVLNRFKNLDAAGKRVNSLMAEVQPSSEVRQEWQEVLQRWKRVYLSLSSFS